MKVFALADNADLSSAPNFRVLEHVLRLRPHAHYSDAGPDVDIALGPHKSPVGNVFGRPYIPNDAHPGTSWAGNRMGSTGPGGSYPYPSPFETFHLYLGNTDAAFIRPPHINAQEFTVHLFVRPRGGGTYLMTEAVNHPDVTWKRWALAVTSSTQLNMQVWGYGNYTLQCPLSGSIVNRDMLITFGFSKSLGKMFIRAYDWATWVVMGFAELQNDDLLEGLHELPDDVSYPPFTLGGLIDQYNGSFLSGYLQFPTVCKRLLVYDDALLADWANRKTDGYTFGTFSATQEDAILVIDSGKLGSQWSMPSLVVSDLSQWPTTLAGKGFRASVLATDTPIITPPMFTNPYQRLNQLKLMTVPNSRYLAFKLQATSDRITDYSLQYIGIEATLAADPPGPPHSTDIEAPHSEEL